MEQGIDCAKKTARHLTRFNYDGCGLLIETDRANILNIRRIRFGGKLHLLMDYTGHLGDVAYPWHTDDFESALRDVLAGRRGLLDACKEN